MRFATLTLFVYLAVVAIAESSNSTSDITTTNSSSSSAPVDPPASLGECNAIMESSCIDDDSVCNECYTSNVGRETEYNECNDNYPFKIQSGMQSTCEMLIKDMCCRSHITESDCLGDDVIMSYWECKLEYYGCSTEALSCEEDPNAAVTGDDDTSGATAGKFGTSQLPPLAGSAILALTVAVVCRFVAGEDIDSI